MGKELEQIISNEEAREPIENALFATGRYSPTVATELAEGIILYLKDAGFSIVKQNQTN